MNDVIKEWIAKADGDFGTAQRELAVEGAANFDAVCFHAQQCIEKLMKAILIAHGQVPPRTHDLIVLADLVALRLPGWQWPVEELRFLSRAAVTFRYPGESAEREDGGEAVDIAARLRQDLIRRLFSL
ncbi:HEPN domain-containing protein [Geoalkalibacter sp.]|uniref:HEPN domain-containing protein n=1 Tax=Geoalkalibacter sp. TaxID=3041440 RepID=UPI00272E5D25|nr:HEPN domain-containing protein [Geoalkalibacter sp.]